MNDPTERPRILGCRSDDIIAELDGDITVIGVKGFDSLRADRALDATKRHELIERIRGGAHAELALTARTFRQKDGVPNRRFLRFKSDALGAIASSFVGMPVLRDHNTWSQTARIGTITASELATHGGTGWSSFRQGLHIVKPEAVISVLDGTLDRFSIGWHHAGAPVLCSVHKTDVRARNSCACWPGDSVEVDGASQIVEYEFQSAEGTEVSAVNVPAVKGTKIEDIRAALAAELSLDIEPRRKATPPMTLPRLAAVLGLAALGAPDEDRAITIVEGLRRDKLAAEQERDTARTALASRDKELSELRAAGDKARIDVLLADATRAGKIKILRDEEGKAIPSAREVRLRKLAARDGVDALAAEIAELDVIVPVGQRVLTDNVKEPERSSLSAPASSALTSVAAQLGLDEKDVLASAAELNATGGF